MTDVYSMYMYGQCLRRRSFLLACWFSANSVWFVCVLFMSPAQVVFYLTVGLVPTVFGLYVCY